MRKAVLYSASLHAAVIVAAYFGVPSLFRSPPVVAPPIAVELVTDQPLEKPKPKPKPAAPKPRPPRAKAPPPPPPAPDIPPPPQTALAVPEPPPEPPPPPKAKPKPKPEPKPEARPAPPMPKVAAPPPRPRPKPPARKPTPKPQPDELQALLKNLAKQKAVRERERKREKQAARQPRPDIPRPAPTPRRSSIETRRLEQELGQMVRRQLRDCWNIPAGAKDAQEMRVEIRIRLSPDGTLRGAPEIIDRNRLVDPFYRAVAESAIRALYNPECRPLRLPLDQYDIWKEITFNFDPGEALDR